MFTIIPTITSAILLQQEKQRKQEEQKKREQEELTSNILLLRGESDFMEIGASETVSMIRATFTGYGSYKIDGIPDNKWVTTINDEIIVTDSFKECFQLVIQKCEATGVQVIPFSTNRGVVDGYWLVVKMSNANKTEKEVPLKKLAEQLTEEIKTAW